VLLGFIAVAGCSKSSNNSTSSSPDQKEIGSGGNAAGAPAEPAPAPAFASDGTTKDSNAQTQPLMPVDQRSLIYTGSINVRVDSVVPAADRAIALTLGLGGIVAGDNRSLSNGGSQATLVLRVPADKFASTLDSLAQLGTEEGRQVTAEDVTDKLVDLDARIAAQRASVDRVRALLAQAQSIADIVSIEGELTRRQADLDSLVQRRAAMSGLVDLATITAVLYGPSGPVVTTKKDTGFLAGLRNGWHGFVASIAVLLTVAGWLLPWAVAIGVPVLVAWLIVRRRRRRRAAVAAAP
jgi:hypothetical protein